MEMKPTSPSDSLGAKFSACALVTNGQITRKILTVKYTGNHFVFIYPADRQGDHMTYHRDGNVLERPFPGRRVYRKTTYSPLDKYTGDAPIFGVFLNIDKPDTWGCVPRETEIEAVTIDLQLCIEKTNVVSVDAPLLIPGDFSTVEFYRKEFSVIACEIFTRTNPWFAIVGYYRA